jgi:hypothetical protein
MDDQEDTVMIKLEKAKIDDDKAAQWVYEHCLEDHHREMKDQCQLI